MHRAFVILTTLSVMAVQSAAFAAQPSHSGLYENVRISSETGDEGGYRLRVNDGASPTVDFELCEGACLGMKRFPARIDGDRLSFVYVEQDVDVSGRPGAVIRAKVEGRFVLGGLKVKIDFAENPSDDQDPFTFARRIKDRR